MPRMNIPTRAVSAISTLLITRVAGRRPPDFVVGADDPAGAYLRRWYLLPRNPVLNLYLHNFMRSDDPRALHDHPWCWASLLLRGSYIEHTIAAGGIHRRQVRMPGSLKVAGPRTAHRVELRDTLNNGPAHCWTLFITGPRVRDWGFHCPAQGFIPWQRFTRAGIDGKPGEIGPGCEG
ncbi:MAG: hypothetical protein ACOH1V_02455 [Stenotrophomonas sp.]